jgi:hypothetical protein
MFRVVLADLSCFVFPSPDTQLIDGTLGVLTSALLEPTIQAGLDAIWSGNAPAFYAVAKPLCAVALVWRPRISPATFTRRCSATVDGAWRVSLYTADTSVVTADSAPAFAEFATRIRADEKLLHGAPRAAILSRFKEFLTVETGAAPSLFLMLIKRIVVVDVPHLYEVGALKERTFALRGLESLCPDGRSRRAPCGERAGERDMRDFGKRGSAAVSELDTADGGWSSGYWWGGVAIVDVKKVEEDVGDEEWGMGFVIIGPGLFLPLMEIVNTIGVEYCEQIFSAEPGRGKCLEEAGKGWTRIKCEILKNVSARKISQFWSRVRLSIRAKM